MERHGVKYIFFLISAIFFFLAAPRAQAAITFVTSTGAVASNISPAINTTGANFLVVACHYWTSSTITVSDSANNTWHALTTYGVDSDNGFVQLSYAYNATTSASQTFTCTAQQYEGITVSAYSGVQSSTDPYDAGTNQGATYSNALTFQPGTSTPSQVGDLFITAYSNGNGNSAVASATINQGFVVTNIVHDGNDMDGGMAYFVNANTTALNPTWTVTATSSTSNVDPAATIAAFKATGGSSPPTLDQNGYRFRNDDGSQTSATWQTVQNTTTTEPAGQNERLRVLVNAAGTPSAGQYQLEYSRNGGAWTVASATIPSTVTQVVTTTGNATFTVPSGITNLTVEAWGGGGGGVTMNVNGAGSGGGGGAYVKKVISVTPLASYPYYVGTGGVSSTAGQDTWFSSTTVLLAKGGGSKPLNTTSSAGIGGASSTSIGDVGYVFGGGSGAVGSASSRAGGGGSSAGTASEGVSATTSTGATAPSGGGNGGNGATSQGAGSPGVQPGGGGGGGKRTSSNTRLGGTGGAGQIRITYAPATSPIILSASPNIAAGGTGTTTAQLSPPSGKATSSFQAGYISDDTNPLASISLATDTYTELEWSMMATSTATTGDTFTFRVTKAGTALDSYSVTPAWIIGSATTTYTQATYRLFNNIASTTVGSPLAIQNASATLAATGAAFRLRMLLAIDNVTSTAGIPFKLKFAPKGSSTCAAATYADVGTTTAIAFNTSNSPAADGMLLQATSTDPNEGRTVVNETYVAANPFVVTSTIPAGEDGNWDFALIDNNASSSTDYCLKAVKSGGSDLDLYSVYPEVMTAAASGGAPTVSSVAIGSSTITLTAATTTPVTVSFQVNDPSGCSSVFTGGNVTTTLYRAAAPMTTTCSANNLNCYVTTAQTNSCTSGSTANATATLNVYYFADSTGNASSSYPSSHWYATVQAKNSTNATGTATSSAADVGVLTAINLSTSSINYGTVAPGADTSSTNQTVIIQNAGNSTTTIQVSGTALTLGVNSIATTSQKYATTSFSYGTGGTQLTDTPTTVSGFILTAPTATLAVEGTTYWGIGIPGGSATGTYNGTTTIAASFYL